MLPNRLAPFGLVFLEFPVAERDQLLDLTLRHTLEGRGQPNFLSIRLDHSVVLEHANRHALGDFFVFVVLQLALVLR